MRSMMAFSTSSRIARADRLVGSASSALRRKYVEGAIGTADRLDPRRRTVLVDEGDHHFGRRSSSACAKNADAFRRISFARFSSTTSRCNRFSSARSSVVRPARSARPPPRCRPAAGPASHVEAVDVQAFVPGSVGDLFALDHAELLVSDVQCAVPEELTRRPAPRRRRRRRRGQCGVSRSSRRVRT
jgi:hypothetical protein